MWFQTTSSHRAKLSSVYDPDYFSDPMRGKFALGTNRKNQTYAKVPVCLSWNRPEYIRPICVPVAIEFAALLKLRDINAENTRSVSEYTGLGNSTTMDA